MSTGSVGPVVRPRAPDQRFDAAARRRGSLWSTAGVTEAMSRPVLTIDAGETLWDAWQLLSVSGLRHLVVVDDGHCVGVISDRNILSDIPVSEDRMRNRFVGDLLSRRPPKVVHETDLLVDVARTMARHSIEAVPVLDAAGRLVGIVTGSDLVRWWADDGA